MAMELIQKVTTTSGQAAVEFLTLPSTYKDLRILICAKSTTSQLRENVIMEVNGDSTNTNYIQYDWYQEDNTDGAEYTTSSAKTRFAAGVSGSGSGVSANAYGATEMFINDYNNASIRQAFYSPFVHYQTSGNWDNWGNGVTWSNTAAITSLVFRMFTGSNFVTGSTISLYGIK